MSTIGERIKNLRKFKGLTQTGLAKRVGVVPSTICGYENNTYTPNIVILKKIAVSINTPLDILLEDTDIEKRFDHSKKQKKVAKPVELEKTAAHPTVDTAAHPTVDTAAHPNEFYKFIKQLNEYQKGGKEYLESQFNAIKTLQRFSDEATARKCTSETERYNNMIEALWAKKFAQRLQKELQ